MPLQEEWNALQLACAQGDNATVKTLLTAAADVDYQLEVTKESPLDSGENPLMWWWLFDCQCGRVAFCQTSRP
jgi:ankyrin repeat protein